jgi:hypothetical protein
MPTIPSIAEGTSRQPRRRDQQDHDQVPVTVGVLVVSQHRTANTPPTTREEIPVGEYLQNFRARVPQQS